MSKLKALNKGNAPKATRPEKIIQFGEGNFLRGFIDWIVKNMNDKTAFDASVVVVAGLPDSVPLRILEKQDGLYHLNLQGKLKGETIDSIELIDVISRSVNPYSDYNDFIKLADQPDMRFVISNTTEAGIKFDPSCRFTDRPASSYPGRLTQLLYRRFKTFNGSPEKGFVIFPCELIFHNGHRLKECVLKYIELWREEIGEDVTEFKEWFERYCFICSTLVDRIVPGFPSLTIDETKERIGFDDNMVVLGEVFHLWVIEVPENLSNERLKSEFPADKADLNVVITDDESPYHERKVTLLNGPHTVLAPVAYLSGVEIVRDACNHPVIGKYIRKIQKEELLPTLNLPETELMDYADSVLERFNNPFVDHKVESIMLNAFPKFATRDLPGIKTYFERKGSLPNGIIFGLAAIITYYKGGERFDGARIKPNDDEKIINLLNSLWSTNEIETVADGVLRSEILWGKDENLTSIPQLKEKLSEYLVNIQQKGMLEALKSVI